MQIKELVLSDINDNMLDYFNRYQEVKKVWRIENNEKVIKKTHFIENWDKPRKQENINEFRKLLKGGGTVLAAFKEENLIAFGTLDSKFIGENNQYLQLLSLHVSYKYRGQGLGTVLFEKLIEKARERGARKLYISAHSSVESIGFYKKAGCIDAKWLYQPQIEIEPYDCQLEYIINRGD